MAQSGQFHKALERLVRILAGFELVKIEGVTAVPFVGCIMILESAPLIINGK
jgi:hypothetical protein